jgi:hypothetical protein
MLVPLYDGLLATNFGHWDYCCTKVWSHKNR